MILVVSDEVRAKTVSTEELLAHIPITEEGKARWRARLKELDAKWTPERREELSGDSGAASLSGD